MAEAAPIVAEWNKDVPIVTVRLVVARETTHLNTTGRI